MAVRMMDINKFAMSGYHQFAKVQEHPANKVGLKCGKECRDLALSGIEPAHNRCE